MNPHFDTPQGNDTKDKVFLLSVNESDKYFASSEDRQCKPAEYAVTNGAYKDEKPGNCNWWLRSAGNDSYAAAFVLVGGSAHTHGIYVDYVNIAVRPALWINPGFKFSGSVII